MKIAPQPGPQTLFLRSLRPDISIFGGAAGGGKTWALLLETLRYVSNPEFNTVIFRRTCPEITNPGGMWPESSKIYPFFGAIPNQTGLLWTFPSGSVVKFAHMQHEKNMHDWLGAQIALLGFDQLERFTEAMFFFMLSRNRSVCGVRPYVRATANPQVGWLADFLAWWIDQDTGFPIPERAGVLRWFIRRDNLIHWADSAAELEAKYEGAQPKSVTFVPAKLEDNPALMRADPGYLANLQALSHSEQERLWRGNWKVAPEGAEWPASYFSQDIWFDDWPEGIVCRATGIDPSKSKDSKSGDYFAIVNIGMTNDLTMWVEADLRVRSAESGVDGGIENQRRFKAEVIGVEANQFLELFINLFRERSERQSVVMPIIPLINTAPKPVRIRRLGPYLMAKKFRFKANSPGTKLVVQQLSDFREPALPESHDDGPDGLEMALRVLIELWNGRQQPMPQRLRA